MNLHQKPCLLAPIYNVSLTTSYDEYFTYFMCPTWTSGPQDDKPDKIGWRESLCKITRIHLISKQCELLRYKEFQVARKETLDYAIYKPATIHRVLCFPKDTVQTKDRQNFDWPGIHKVCLLKTTICGILRMASKFVLRQLRAHWL